MRDDFINSSFYYSLGLHSFFFIAVAIYILFGAPSHKSVSMVVSLVESTSKGNVEAPEEETPAPVEEEAGTTLTPPKPEPKKSIADQRIAALEAKKRVERIASARRQVSISKTTRPPAGGTSGGGTYESLIMGRITRNWATADFLNKNKGLLAIVTIRIARNGSVTIVGWEKKSGNPLFDREALRAINDSSPLPPPPGEMEIGVRFNP
jgi:TonB family protein